MKRFLLGLAGCVVLVAVLIQLVPVDRSNPPVEEVVDAPPDVLAVLRRACWDCHSNQTAWPWYAYVAPASWTVTGDVKAGRGHVNFTTWNRYDAGTRLHLRHEIAEEVEEGAMPLPLYVSVHPEAVLDEAERRLLMDWATSAGGPEATRLPESHEAGEAHERHDH